MLVFVVFQKNGSFKAFFRILSAEKCFETSHFFWNTTQWTTEPEKSRASRAEPARYYCRAEQYRAEPHGVFTLILTSKTDLLVI